MAFALHNMADAASTDAEIKDAWDKSLAWQTARNKPVASIPEVLMNPEKYPASMVANAKKLWADEHKAQAGELPVPARNPTLPQDVRDPSVLEHLDPGKRAIVQALVDYKYPMPTGYALTKPEWQQYMGLAQQYDPSFDASQYAVRQKTRQSYANGKDAQSIQAFNTLAGHVGRLEQNFKTLNNTNFMPGIINPVENWFGGHLSGDTQSRLNKAMADTQAVAEEAERAWRGVGGSEHQIQGWKDRLSTDMSPKAQMGVIDEMFGLIAEKMGGMKSNYEKVMGRPMDFHMLTPETAAAFKSHGVDVRDLAPGATYGGGATPQPRIPTYNPRTGKLEY
jgi:hypothetical protein